jgi:osmotically-inducible protein OsmY
MAQVVHKSDADIHRDVLEELAWDSRVEETEVGVQVSDGVVTSKAPTPAAANVRRAIEDVLERRAEREARRVHVDVHDGTVTLTGPVHSWAERKSIVAAARFTPGVRAVEDRLLAERS